jgi:hypothetical protein
MANLRRPDGSMPEPGDPDYLEEDAPWNPDGQPLGGYGGYDQPISPELRTQANALGAQGFAHPQASPALPQPPGMAAGPMTLGGLAAPGSRARPKRKRPGTDLNPAADFLSRSPVPPGAPAPLGAMPTDSNRRRV